MPLLYFDSSHHIAIHCLRSEIKRRLKRESSDSQRCYSRLTEFHIHDLTHGFAPVIRCPLVLLTIGNLAHPGGLRQIGKRDGNNAHLSCW